MAKLSQEHVRFGVKDTDVVLASGLFLMFRNKLKGFRDFYHGTSVGAGSPKVNVYRYCPSGQLVLDV
jgi:hypothetical protein